MHLIQLLLPLYDNRGRPFPHAKLTDVQTALTRQFGGVTVYSRAPAQGLSKDGGDLVRDDIVVFEVMSRELSKPWWATYRAHLEKAFAQDKVIVRASLIELL